MRLEIHKIIREDETKNKAADGKERQRIRQGRREANSAEDQPQRTKRHSRGRDGVNSPLFYVLKGTKKQEGIGVYRELVRGMQDKGSGSSISDQGSG